jgi:hypothetical protein
MAWNGVWLTPRFELTPGCAHRSGYDSRSESGADTDIGQGASSRAARPAPRSRQAQPAVAGQLQQHAAAAGPPGAVQHTEADVEGAIGRLCVLTFDACDKQQYRAEFKRAAARGPRIAAPTCT